MLLRTVGDAPTARRRTFQHKQIQPVTTREEISDATERLHVLQRDFHLTRKFFRKRSAAAQKKAEDFAASVAQARASNVAHPEIMAE